MLYHLREVNHCTLMGGEHDFEKSFVHGSVTNCIDRVHCSTLHGFVERIMLVLAMALNAKRDGGEYIDDQNSKSSNL